MSRAPAACDNSPGADHTKRPLGGPRRSPPGHAARRDIVTSSQVSSQKRTGGAATRPSAENQTLSTAGRAGFSARGVVYVLIGALAIQLALASGGKSADRRGALAKIAEQPFVASRPPVRVGPYHRHQHPGSGRPDVQPFTQRLRRDRPLARGPVAGILVPGPLEQVIPVGRRLGGLLRARPRGDCGWRALDGALGPGSRHRFAQAARRRILALHAAEGLQHAGADLGPADQQQRADRIKGGLPELARQEGSRHVQRQRHRAGEHQQPAGGAHLVWPGAVQRHMADGQQEAQHRQIHGRGHERCHPRRHAQTQRQRPHVAEAEKKRQADDHAGDARHRTQRHALLDGQHTASVSSRRALGVGSGAGDGKPVQTGG
ncbi:MULTISPECIES: DUF1206 domain-containing protein [unclassified Streptomyces]|uniref:DUF1206 domain-containing protein n=1 Tax=unclassified Streptomyces TaxID=2593676 RepID=UPI00331CE870